MPYIIETRYFGDQESLAYETTPPLEDTAEPMFGCPGNLARCDADCRSNGFPGGECDRFGLRCSCYDGT